jgi:hypothetical protein
MSSRSDDRADRRADESAELVAEMRACVEVATRRLDELTTELGDRQVLVDVLESVVDLLLDLGDTVVVVVDADQRITGVSRAAAERFEGAAVGKPLSSVVPDAIAEQLVTRVHSAHEIEAEAAGEAARVHPLPGGGAMLVLP